MLNTHILYLPVFQHVCIHVCSLGETLVKITTNGSELNMAKRMKDEGFTYTSNQPHHHPKCMRLALHKMQCLAVLVVQLVDQTAANDRELNMTLYAACRTIEC